MFKYTDKSDFHIPYSICELTLPTDQCLYFNCLFIRAIQVGEDIQTLPSFFQSLGGHIAAKLLPAIKAKNISTPEQIGIVKLYEELKKIKTNITLKADLEYVSCLQAQAVTTFMMYLKWEFLSYILGGIKFKVIYSNHTNLLTKKSVHDELAKKLFSSENSRELAIILSENLGVHFLFCHIQKTFNHTYKNHFLSCITKQDSIIFFDPYNGFIIFSGDDYQKKFSDWFSKESTTGNLNYLTTINTVVDGIKNYRTILVEMATFDVPIEETIPLSLTPGQLAPPRDYFCGWCEKKLSSDSPKCGQCRQVYYCGKECQLQHWKNTLPFLGHKSECKKV